MQQIFLYQKMAVKVFIVSPGRFYHSSRKLNMVELDMGFKYIYTLGWVKKLKKLTRSLVNFAYITYHSCVTSLAISDSGFGF